MQEFFREAGFSTSLARRKVAEQLGTLGSAANPPQWAPGTSLGKFWLFFILKSSKHCSHCSATTNGDESLHR